VGTGTWWALIGLVRGSGRSWAFVDGGQSSTLVRGGQSWALVRGGRSSALVHGRSWAFVDGGRLSTLVRGGLGPSSPLMGGDGGSSSRSWVLFTIGTHVVVSRRMTTLGGGYSPVGRKTEYDNKRRISCCSAFGCHAAVHDVAPDSGVQRMKWERGVLHSPGLACMSPVVDGDEALRRPHSDDATRTLPSGSPLTGAHSLGGTGDMALPRRSCHVVVVVGCRRSWVVVAIGGGKWWRQVVTVVVGGDERVLWMMVVVEERGMWLVDGIQIEHRCLPTLC